MRIAVALVVLLIAYLLLWPVPIAPVAWQAPHNKGFSGPFAPNNKLSELVTVDLASDHGPEDVTLGADGNIYLSLHAGTIARFDPNQQQIQPWLNTQGRPLGMAADKDGSLWVADAMRGLLHISANGDIQTELTEAAGAPIGYADDVDVARSGWVYFSDASQRFPAAVWGDTLQASLLDLMEHSGSGRLIGYDPQTGDTQVLVDDLVFANGVTLSHDQKSILINETGRYRVLRYWLAGEKQGQTEVVIDNLPGFPDNISRAGNGGYWLGLASPRSKALDTLAPYPWLRKIVQRLPAFVRPKAQAYGHVLKIDENGQVVASLQDPEGKYPLTTGVLETPQRLYISSLGSDALGWLAKP